VSGVQDGRHDRTAFRTPPVRSIRPDTVHSTRHAMANRKRRGQGTDERHGRRSDILDRHDHKAAHQDTSSPRLRGRRLRLGNQGWLGDGKTANATVTTAATRQMLGVALPSKPRLGALLSCVGFGWYERRAMGLRRVWCAGSDWCGSAGRVLEWHWAWTDRCAGRGGAERDARVWKAEWCPRRERDRGA
jgi:hypothetical protein